MKILLTAVLISVGLANVFAQGTVQFYSTLSGGNETPPINSFFYGSATYSLTSGSLSFVVDMQPANFPSSAGIYGPARAGQIGSLIFDLGSPAIVAPIGTFPGEVEYQGARSITQQQISDLERGFWYVNILTPSNPGGEIRGQILPVPEPSSLALLFVAVSSAISMRRYKCGQR